MPKFMLILRGDATADYSKFTPDDFAKILGVGSGNSGTTRSGNSGTRAGKKRRRP
jgi:hypothetical protein